MSLSVEMHYKQILDILQLPMCLTLKKQSLSGAQYHIRRVHTTRCWQWMTRYHPGRAFYSERKLWCDITSAIQLHTGKSLCCYIETPTPAVTAVTKFLNRLTPNDPYMGRTAPLTSKRCILYIYSTNIGTEYFKYALYSPFFSLQNAVCFIMLTCLVAVLFTFYIQVC